MLGIEVERHGAAAQGSAIGWPILLQFWLTLLRLRDSVLRAAAFCTASALFSSPLLTSAAYC